MRFILVAAVWGIFGGLAWAEVPQANLEQFRKEVEPVLKRVCVECHGPKKQKAKFRVDTLAVSYTHLTLPTILLV